MSVKIGDGERRYGCWIGNPDGVAENPAHCIEIVWGSDRWEHGHQCSRKRGHGPDGLWCKTHSPEATAQRRAIALAKYERIKSGWERGAQETVVVETARKVFRQEASFDDLKREVVELERLIAACGP